MEITRPGTGRRPNFRRRTANITVCGTRTTNKAIIRYANAGPAAVVLYLVTQFAVGGLLCSGCRTRRA